MNLYAIEDGDRIQGDSDDRDLYVVAKNPIQAVAIWQGYYDLENDAKPYRVWQVTAATMNEPARALDWAEDVVEAQP